MQVEKLLEIKNNESLKKESKRLIWNISDVFRNGHDINKFKVYYSLFLLYLIKQQKNLDDNNEYDVYEMLDTILLLNNDLLRELLTSYRDLKEVYRLIKPFSDNCSTDAIIYALLFDETFIENGFIEFNSPDSLIRLGQALLNINKKSEILDLCSGVGSFIQDTVLNYKFTSISGAELNHDAYVVSLIKSFFYDADVHLEQADALSNFTEKKYNCIFADFPLGYSRFHRDNYHVSGQDIDFLNHPRCVEWRYIYQLTRLLSDNDAKAVAYIPIGPLFQTIQQKAREYFVKSGYIESVIALPERLMSPYVGMSVYCLILSKGNSSIKMIDARQIFHKERRRNILTDDNIKQILELIASTDSPNIVEFGDLYNKGFSLLPEDYLTPFKNFENGVRFKDLINSVTRGAPLTANRLDEMTSSNETNYQYLQIKDINQGIINNNLPYINITDNKFDKYCIENGNLILSKIGTYFKVAVADFDRDTNVIGCGNLYIIKVNEDKVLPNYLKAFFESNIGASYLKNIARGGVIPSITVKELNEIQIPLPSLEKQKELVEEYLAIEDEIKVLRMRLEDADTRRKNIITLDSLE